MWTKPKNNKKVDVIIKPVKTEWYTYITDYIIKYEQDSKGYKSLRLGFEAG